MKKQLFIDYPTDKRRGDLANAVMRSVTILSIILMIISSVKSVEEVYYHAILALEFIISIIFLGDFLIRAHLSGRKRKFFTNIFNIFDLLASVPFIIAFGFHGYLAVGYLKILRVTRIARVFRLGKYFTFLTNLTKALKKNAYKYKIAGVFFLISILLASFTMYLIEGRYNSGFNSIPNSLWRSIVTMGTVGYGDVYPITTLGKIVGGVFILFGPIFVAIISSISIITFLDVMKFTNKENCEDSICNSCKKDGHEDDAKFCRICGDKLSSTSSSNSFNSYILDKY